MKKYLCFDIGGLSLKYSIYDMDLNEYENNKIEYNLMKRKDIWIEIKNIYETHKKNYPNLDIAISSSGIINSVKNNIVETKNSENKMINESNIYDILNLKNVTIKIDNDARCALRSEMELGVGKGYKNILMLTIGTALGGSICVNNQIIIGHDYFSGEIGCGYFDFSEEKNISQYCGMYSLMLKYKESTNKWINGFNIWQNAKNGNEFEIKIVNEQVFNISKVIVNSTLLLNPDLVIIGGAVSKNKWFLELLNRKVQELCDKTMLKFKVNIKPAKHLNESGKLGALMLYKNSPHT